MLIVASDRLSAFDVIFDQPILDKGKILTSIANYWFDKTEHIIQNHLTGDCAIGRSSCKGIKGTRRASNSS